MKERDMEYSHSDSLFDYYRCKYILGEEVLNYCFRADREEDICFYGRLGAADQPSRETAFPYDSRIFVPDWCKGAVMYQIYVDRFCNGDPTNDVETNEYIYIGKPVERVRDWNELPSKMDVRRFYGGDIRGIWDKLSYLKSLKVEAIYLNPIFVSPSNHKYDCQDYDHVDPHFRGYPARSRFTCGA